MPSLSTYALFVGTALVLLAIPGPAVLYVVGRSIDQGRTAGLASVLGITTGTIVHITAATVGLSSLVLASEAAFDAVRYVGAAYLVLLGVRRLLTRGGEETAGGRAPRTLRRLYTQGLVVNMSDGLYALVAGTVADQLRGAPLVARVERWFGGTVLIGLGVAAALVAPHRN